jgi:hypothetical protein
MSEKKRLGQEAGPMHFVTGGGRQGWRSPHLFLSVLSLLLLSNLALAAQGTTPAAKFAGRGSTPMRAAVDAKYGATAEEWAAARGLEALFADMMIQEMRKSVPENDIVPLSQGERIFRQMLDSEYARMLTEAGTLGVADLVVAQMKGRR